MNDLFQAIGIVVLVLMIIGLLGSYIMLLCAVNDIDRKVIQVIEHLNAVAKIENEKNATKLKESDDKQC